MQELISNSNKICSKCKQIKNIAEFNFVSRKDNILNDICRACNKKHYQENKARFKAATAKYRNNNKEKYKESKKKSNKKYREKHKKEIARKNKIYREQHLERERERAKIYQKNNKEKINETKKNKIRERRKNDISFRLRSLISRQVARSLLSANSAKENVSILKVFPYTMNELKQHLEKQFEPWMTWANHGRLNAETWDDADQSTWTWHIDHIIPQSLLPYTSMDDENFKKCWALSNLRPLSAKENIIKGAKKLC